jgi:hypothetical protein
LTQTDPVSETNAAKASNSVMPNTNYRPCLLSNISTCDVFSEARTSIPLVFTTPFVVMIISFHYDVGTDPSLWHESLSSESPAE